MLPIFKNTNYNKRRQDLRDTYILNGAVYVIRYSNILKKLSFINNKTVAHIMPTERSVDIDNFFDFKPAEMWLKFNK